MEERISRFFSLEATKRARVFGEFQLTFVALPADGTAVPVTVSYNGTPLGTEALRTLVAPQCMVGSRADGIGVVVAKYPQINCMQTMITAASQAFTELLPSLVKPFNSLDDVGYQRVFDLGEGKKSFLWTETDIRDIAGPERVPFIQARDDGSGNMTFFVGLTAVRCISEGVEKQTAMMIQDGYGLIGRIWSESLDSDNDRD